jgi:hypothetical protein
MNNNNVLSQGNNILANQILFPASCGILNKSRTSILDKLPISQRSFLRWAIIGCIFGTVSAIVLSGDFSQIIYGGPLLLVLIILKLWFDSMVGYQIIYSDSEFKLIKKRGLAVITIPPNLIQRLDFSPNANVAKIETVEKLLYIIVQKDHHNSLVQLVQQLRKKNPYLNPGAQIKPAENVKPEENFTAKKLTSAHIIAFIIGAAVTSISFVQFFQIYSPETWNYICLSCGAPFGIFLLFFSIGTFIKPQQISITPTCINVSNLIGKQSITFDSIKGLTIESAAIPTQPLSEILRTVKVTTGAEKPVNLFNLNAYEAGEHILSILLHFVNVPVSWLEK